MPKDVDTQFERQCDESDAIISFEEGFMEEVQEERNKQRQRYGRDFDRGNSRNDWIAYLTKYAGDAADCRRNRLDADRDPFRKLMVKVAALAMAAVEAHETEEEG